MRNVLFPILLFCYGLLALFVYVKHGNQADLSYERAAVYIIGSEEGNGSGVMIAPHMMLTAAHVTAEEGLLVGPEALPYKLLKTDKELDLSLIKVAIDCPCIPLAGVVPALDSEALIIGFPINAKVGAQYATKGTFQGLVGHRLKSSAPAIPGNSGGATLVFERGRWRLAGILIEGLANRSPFGVEPVPNYNNSVDVDTIKAFLRPEAPKPDTPTSDYWG